MRHKAYFSGGPKDGEWHDLEHIGVKEVIGPASIDPIFGLTGSEIPIEFKTEVKGHYIPDHIIYRWQGAGDDSGAVEGSSMSMSKGTTKQ